MIKQGFESPSARKVQNDMERIYILREWLRREKASLEAAPFGLTEAETEYLNLIGELLGIVDGRLLMEPQE